MPAKRKADPFVEAITKASKRFATDDLSAALGEVVKKRAAKPKRRPFPPHFPTPEENRARAARAAPRRVGKMQRYTATDKYDPSRYGTFRKYMIATIRAHSNTYDANKAHALCENPKFAKNKLDFRWAADNGYITFD